MNRKSFLSKGTAAVAGGALGLVACQPETNKVSEGPNIITNKTIEWRMVTTWPPNFPVLGESCNLLAKWIEEMSGGRLKIQVFGSGELIPGLEVFDAVSNGAVEMGNGVSYYWSGKIPAAQFFASVPFGMNAQQMNAWIIAGGGMSLWEELYAPYNLIPMLAGNTGVQMGGWFNREIKDIDDVKGLKMRMPGLGAKVLSKAGGSPKLVAGGEIYTNLERGVIDATEWIGPYHDYIMGFHEIAKYYYYPGWHETGTCIEGIVNKEKFEALPSDLQAIIRFAMAYQNSWTFSEFEARNQSYLDKIRNESEVSIRPYPKEVISVLREYTKETLEEIVAKDAKSKKVFEAYSAFRNTMTSWSSITEKIYYDQIQS